MITLSGKRESVVVVARIPPSLAVQFPVKPEDDSPPHVTIWFQGELDEAQVDTFVDAVRVAVERVGRFTAQLTGNLGYFQHDDKRVAYAEVTPITEFHMLHLAIQGELMMGGIFSEADYSDSFQPHATVAYLPVNGLWFGPCPTGSFRVPQVEIWGAGLDIPIDIGQSQYEPLMKTWVRAHTSHSPGGTMFPVVGYQDSRIKKPPPPHAPPRPHAQQQQTGGRQSQRPENSIDSRYKEVAGRAAKFASAVRSIDTIKDPEGKFKIGRGHYSPKQASQAIRRWQKADAIRMQQARVDRADLANAPVDTKAAKLKQSVQKIADHINGRGGLNGTELTNGKMHAKLRLEGDAVKADMFDEHGIAVTHTYKSAANAILSLAQRGYHKGADGTMDKLQGTVKWLYGNRGAEAVKNAEQLRAQGKEFGANKIEQDFLNTNGVDENDMVAKDEIQRRVAHLLDLGSKEPSKLDPEDASEVARILKKQKPKSFGEHEKKVEHLATEDLLTPEETKQSLLMQIVQDRGRARLAKQEKELQDLVNGRGAPRLTLRNVNKVASKYMNQLHDYFDERGLSIESFDPDTLEDHVQTIQEERGKKFVSQTLGKELTDFINMKPGLEKLEARAKLKKQSGGNIFGTDFIHNVIKLQGRYVASIKGREAGTEEISLPVQIIDHHGNTVEFPAFNDERAQNRHMDEQWLGAGIHHLKSDLADDQERLNNWKNNFGDLVDASRKIQALRYQLRDPDFHDSPNGQLARDLLDHMSKKREKLWGIETPDSEHGGFGDLYPSSEQEREPEEPRKPQIPVQTKPTRASGKKKKSEKFEQEEVPF